MCNSTNIAQIHFLRFLAYFEKLFDRFFHRLYRRYRAFWKRSNTRSPDTSVGSLFDRVAVIIAATNRVVTIRNGRDYVRRSNESPPLIRVDDHPARDDDAKQAKWRKRMRSTFPGTTLRRQFGRQERSRSCR